MTTARALYDDGVRVLFGLVGGGNFLLAKEFGGRYVGLRHEMNAVAAADAYARTTRSVGVVTVTQGPGLTHAVTAIVEAVKSGTPMLILVPDERRSNQAVNSEALAAAIGAGYEPCRLRVARARAIAERRPILVGLPADGSGVVAVDDPLPAKDDDVAAAAELLSRASSPAILAGRGAYLADAGPALVEVAERLGAPLATTVMANGLFAGHPLNVGVCGGFGDDAVAARLAETDVLLAVGTSLNPWTTRHGALFADATVIRVDDRVDTGILADAKAFATALRDRLPEPLPLPSLEPAAPPSFPPIAADGRLDARALTVALDGLLPAERCVTVDGGHFSGWPVMHLRAADPVSVLYPHGFQSIGLGLGSVVGLALACPDRLPVAMVGDGGLVMSLGELDTLLAEQLPVLVVVYNDHAYGAELHSFADSSLAQLPARDFAAVFRAMGGQAHTIRDLDDLRAIGSWLRDPAGPLLLDCQISQAVVAPWLRHAF